MCVPDYRRVMSDSLGAVSTDALLKGLVALPRLEAIDIQWILSREQIQLLGVRRGNTLKSLTVAGRQAATHMLERASLYSALDAIQFVRTSDLTDRTLEQIMTAFP